MSAAAPPARGAAGSERFFDLTVPDIAPSALAAAQNFLFMAFRRVAA